MGTSGGFGILFALKVSVKPVRQNQQFFCLKKKNYRH